MIKQNAGGKKYTIEVKISASPQQSAQIRAQVADAVYKAAKALGLRL